MATSSGGGISTGAATLIALVFGGVAFAAGWASSGASQDREALRRRTKLPSKLIDDAIRAVHSALDHLSRTDDPMVRTTLTFAVNDIDQVADSMRVHGVKLDANGKFLLADARNKAETAKQYIVHGMQAPGGPSKEIVMLVRGLARQAEASLESLMRSLPRTA